MVGVKVDMIDTRDLIRLRLDGALAPVYLQIDDESGRHRGHAGAGGGGHYRLRIVSAAFEGLTVVARQRLVYQALAEEMLSVIHALAMTTQTPAEAAGSAHDSDRDLGAIVSTTVATGRAARKLA